MISRKSNALRTAGFTFVEPASTTTKFISNVAIRHTQSGTIIKNVELINHSITEKYAFPRCRLPEKVTCQQVD